MDIGRRLRRARLEAGLSQRQLCGELITRNMLSQIENGTTLPSVPTLAILAGRLHKPVGYFFGDPDLPVGNPLTPAWEALRDQNPDRAMAHLESTRGGGKRERELLTAMTLMARAARAAEEGRSPYAVRLLEQAGEVSLPRELERSRLLLLGQLQEKPEEIVEKLPSLDRELILRARAALDQGKARRAGELLDAAEDRESPDWSMLRGRAWLEQKEYSQAAACFHRAEDRYPAECAGYLEICYRELEDFRQAYLYACRQKGSGQK